MLDNGLLFLGRYPWYWRSVARLLTLVLSEHTEPGRCGRRIFLFGCRCPSIRCKIPILLCMSIPYSPTSKLLFCSLVFSFPCQHCLILTPSYIGLSRFLGWLLHFELIINLMLHRNRAFKHCPRIHSNRLIVPLGCCLLFQNALGCVVSCIVSRPTGNSRRC